MKLSRMAAVVACVWFLAGCDETSESRELPCPENKVAAARQWAREHLKTKDAGVTCTGSCVLVDVECEVSANETLYSLSCPLEGGACRMDSLLRIDKKHPQAGRLQYETVHTPEDPSSMVPRRR